MYKATYQLKVLGEFKTLSQAFKAIYAAIKAEKVLLWQIIDSTIWIELIELDEVLAYWDFYQARDEMCQQGYLVDGKWVSKEDVDD